MRVWIWLLATNALFVGWNLICAILEIAEGDGWLTMISVPAACIGIAACLMCARRIFHA